MFKSRKNRTITIFVLLSVFIHSILWLGLLTRPATPPTPQRQDHVEVEIVPLQIPPEEEKKQIVTQEQQQNKEIDPKAKFLSAFDQKVEKETKVDRAGEFKNSSRAGKKAAPQPKSIANQETPEEEMPRASKRPSFDSLKPQFVPRPVEPQIAGDNGQAEELAATDDYLKDVDKGMQTMLSTREFVYYSYYSRIKERIRQHWEPSIREKVKMIYRTGRSIASTKDHITQVVITLNTAGELDRVDVVTPSGVEQLDDAAVDAFRAAQPFPNPPKGLIENDGKIRIRWDFVLEANNFRIGITKRIAKGQGNESHPSRGL